jgi:3-oxoacyl-[acyl-carrier-protein] synthase III
VINDIAIYLPAGRLGNEELANALGRWTPAEIFAKTGIRTRCIAAEGETAADLGLKALTLLLSRQKDVAIDFLILCTQSADYKLPASAGLLQASSGLPCKCGCLDINLACSGFVYGLMLAEGLIEGGTVRSVVLVNSDTYSHYIHPKDSVCRPIFGDGAAATLISSEVQGGRSKGFSFGTDGSHARQLYLPAGGGRTPAYRGENGNWPGSGPKDPEFIYMNGPEIFNFTLQVVPGSVTDTLARCQLSAGDVDYFIFHQANGFMLEALRKKMGLPSEKFVVEMADTGNLVSASIPVVIARMRADGRIKTGTRTLLCGFGVGLSWASCVVEW